MKLPVSLSSLYAKLILAFLVVLTPVYIISLKMNEYGELTVRKEVENSMKSRVHFYIRLLENEFTRIVHMQKEFINDRDLRKASMAFSIMSDIEFRETVYALNARLKAMMNSSVYMSDADLFLPAESRHLSAVSFYDKLPVEEYEALKTVSRHPHNPFVYWKNRLFVSFPYSDLALINEEEPIFLLSAEISQSELTEVLNRMKIDSGGGAMIMGSGGDWSVTSDDANPEARETVLPLLQQDKEPENEFRVVEMGGRRNWMAYEKSPTLGITLFMYMPEEDMLGSQAKYRQWFWMLSGISILVVIFFSYWIFRQIHLPMKRLVRAFRHVEEGNLTIEIRNKRSDEFHYLYGKFNEMVRRIKELVHEVYEQKYRANLSELRQLQSQISPHFLYNSFFILSRMAKYEEYESIRRLSQYLGSYFKFVTRTHMEEAPLDEEVNHARTYVQIQTFRFEERIQVSFGELPERLAGMKVPRLLIQPLVENAYEHGLKNKMSEGRLSVEFVDEEERLIVKVEDNGEGLSEEDFAVLNAKLTNLDEDMETTGLVNVHRRLVLRYGTPGGLRLTNFQGKGFGVEMILPKEAPLV
ncbi:histidine kinase [Paenibacillus aurantius]|uniref:Histidine kinase n=1 Tax=Paenibacillus aurantius TaxID=2918900 RepID=A0AA96RAZ6_9BACL|nr:histidine kinase [Paenibacillus aurantius]WNQ08965.1 histidine kinase [Paenibacillus aurantius]